MKKFSFQNWLQKLRLVAARFPFTLFFIIGLAFEFFLKINGRDLLIPDRNWAFFSVGIPMTIALTLFLEEFKNLIFSMFANLIAVILLLLYCYSLPQKFYPADVSQQVVLGIVFSLSAFVVSYFGKNTDISFWKFSKTSVLQLIISFIFSQVLMLGLSLAILSLKELFKIDVNPKVYGNLAVICYVVFAPIYFLTNIPDKTEKHNQKFSFDKFLKVLGLYILLPILAIYTLILYVYLFQIIIKWQLPEGWVSWLVSILALGGLLCMMILYPLRLYPENKIVSNFSKFFPVILLPLLVLMTIGIFRRFGDYGLTINRAYVFLFNFWLYGISVYLFFSKSAHLKWIIISFVTVAFIFSIGPWSVYNVTRRTIVKEIGQLLNEAHLLKKGKVIDNSNLIIRVNDTLGIKLTNKVEYVCLHFGNESIQQFYKDSLGNKTTWDIEKTLGINATSIKFQNKTNVNYFNANLQNENNITDITNFKTFIKINKGNEIEKIYKTKDISVLYKNNTIYVTKSGDKNQTLSISLKDKLNYIIRANNSGNNFNVSDLSQEGASYKLIINRIAGFQRQNEVTIIVTELQADLFIK